MHKLIITFASIIMSVGIANAGDKAGALEALNDRFNDFAANHDAAGLISLYAEDTLWIEQGKPVSQGLDGPKALFEFIAENKGSVTHTIDHLFVSEDETLAVMIGSVEAKMEAVQLDATGTYLFVLKPGDEGWKVVTDMWHQHAEAEG